MAAGLAAELLGVVAAIAFDGPVGYELAAALITTGGLLLGVGALSFALGPKG